MSKKKKETMNTENAEEQMTFVDESPGEEETMDTENVDEQPDESTQEKVMTAEQFDNIVKTKINKMLKDLFHSGKPYTAEELEQYLSTNLEELFDKARGQEELQDTIINTRGIDNTMEKIYSLPEKDVLELKFALFKDFVTQFVLSYINQYGKMIQEQMKQQQEEMAAEDKKRKQQQEDMKTENAETESNNPKVVPLSGNMNTNSNINKGKNKKK